MRQEVNASAESEEDRSREGGHSMAGEETGEGEGPGQVKDSHTAWSALPTASSATCSGAACLVCHSLLQQPGRCCRSREDGSDRGRGCRDGRTGIKERRAKVPGGSSPETGRG